MTVPRIRLTQGAATLVSAVRNYGLPLDRDGLNEACRRNHLLGSPDGKSVQIVVKALEKVGEEAVVELAHADDFDFGPPPMSIQCSEGRCSFCRDPDCEHVCHAQARNEETKRANRA